MRSIPELPRARCRTLFFVVLTSVAGATLPHAAAIAAGAGLAMALLSLLAAGSWGRAFALAFVLADWIALSVVIIAGGGAGGAQVLWIAPLALIELRPAPAVEWPALTAPALVLPAALLIAQPGLGGSRSGGVLELVALYAAGALVAGLTSGALAAAAASHSRALRARPGRRLAPTASPRRAALPRRAASPPPPPVRTTAPAAPAASVFPAAAVSQTPAAVVSTPPASRSKTSPGNDVDRTTGLPGLGHVASRVGTCMRRSADWNVPLSLLCLRFTGSADDERAAAVCARRLSRRLRHDELAFRVREDTILAALLGRDRADAVALAAALEHELPAAVAARAGGRPEVVAAVTAYDGRCSLHGLLCDTARAVDRELVWEASSR